MSLPLTAGEGARARGTETGGAGATREDRSGASVWWGGASGREVASAWRSESEEWSGWPGRKLAAAAGRVAGSLGVLKEERWLET